jgi:hypothetical protein
VFGVNPNQDARPPPAGESTWVKLHLALGKVAQGDTFGAMTQQGRSGRAKDDAMPDFLHRAMSQGLFRALWDVGLDRKQLSIHEMLTDILEVVAVAEGLKPAHLAGQGEGAVWRIDAFERIATAAGLCTLRTASIGSDPSARWAKVAAEFPLIAEIMIRGCSRAQPETTPRRVLWIHRDPRLAALVGRLVAGAPALVPSVLGYPWCCAEFDARGELAFVRALLRLYEDQHGLRGEAEVAAALEAGLAVRPGPAASEDLEPVWRTRLIFPYLGHTACPDCLARPETSPSGTLNRVARALAFRLDPGFGGVLGRAALGEAALATRGNFQALDPASADPCPCGDYRTYSACCAGRPNVLPEFR